VTGGSWGQLILLPGISDRARPVANARPRRPNVAPGARARAAQQRPIAERPTPERARPRARSRRSGELLPSAFRLAQSRPAHAHLRSTRVGSFLRESTRIDVNSSLPQDVARRESKHGAKRTRCGHGRDGGAGEDGPIRSGPIAIARTERGRRPSRARRSRNGGRPAKRPRLKTHRF
jgi:hypothetical protein